jgi:hypothetical protein
MPDQAVENLSALIVRPRQQMFHRAKANATLDRCTDNDCQLVRTFSEVDRKLRKNAFCSLRKFFRLIPGSVNY